MKKSHSPLKAALALILLAPLAHAANYTWLNSGTDWNTPANWTPNNTGPGSADTALFNTAATNQPNLSANTTISTLNLFSNAGGWTLSANANVALTLNSTSATTQSEAIYVGNGSGTADTISAPIVLGAANGTTQVINVNGGGSNLNITGPISSTNSPTLRFTIVARGSGLPSITLSGNNTYTGTTEINGGQAAAYLLLNNANALGGGGNITFVGSGTNSGILQYSTNNLVDYSARFKNSTGTISISNAAAAGAITFASSIDSSNIGGLNLLGDGNKTLSAANSYGGNTTLAAGNLFLGNNSALSSGTLSVTNNNSQVSASINNLSVANAISIASGVNAKFSSLAGSNNSTYSGPITLVAANSILNLTTAANTVTTFSGNITGLGGITLAHATAAGATVISGNNSYSGNTTLTTGILRIGNNNALGTGTLNNNGIGSSIPTVSSDSTTARTLANNISFGPSAQSFFGNATNNGALTFNGTVALNNSTTLTVLSRVAFNGVVSGTNFIMGSSSTSTLAFAGSNTYTGTTTINGGTLSINSIQDGGSATANALGTPTAGANSIIALGTTSTLQYTGTGNSSNRVINLTTNSGTYTLDASGPSGTFALTGGITNSGTTNTSLLVLTGSGLGSESGSFANGTGSNTGAVTKNGNGTWTLSGSNTYSGLTTVNAGTLIINGTSSGNGGLTVANGATFGRSVTTALTLGGATTFAPGSTIALTLGNGVNSSLARSSGTWSLASNEAFVFDLTNAVEGSTYSILTGLASVPSLTGWTWSSNMVGAVGSFSANGTTGVNFNLTTIPEPTTWALLVFSLTTVMILRRRRSF